MENAKNSFYIALRNRLAVLNPSRTMIVRGVTRPGILLEENELVSQAVPADVFVLRTQGLVVREQLPNTLGQLTMEIEYATAGTSAHGGLDRGQKLAAMDGELSAILQPASTPKMDYTQAPAAAMSTAVFWTDPAFTAVTEEDGTLTRKATVQLFSVQEPGEL